MGWQQVLGEASVMCFWALVLSMYFADSQSLCVRKCLQLSYSLHCVFWMKLVQCLSVGRCARVNNLLFQTSLSPSSLLVGCVLSWQVVETGKLQTNICLPVWQASPLKGRELFCPSAGALQGVGWWGRDTCSSSCSSSLHTFISPTMWSKRQTRTLRYCYSTTFILQEGGA